MFRLLVLGLACISIVIGNNNLRFHQANEEYYISEFQLDFPQSYAACKRYGWALAGEKTSEESDAVNTALRGAGLDGYDFWLEGYHQIDGIFYPIWMWLESGEEFNYTNWQSGEPSGSGYNCLQKRSSESNGQWKSQTCTSSSYFICQKLK